jgi:cytochrome c-type biogenesis protein CcmH
MADRPDDPKGWLLLARAYTKLGQVNKAIEAYRRVLELQPENTRAAMAMGGLMVASSDGQVPPEAMKIFQKIADGGSAPPMVQFYLGMGHMQTGDSAAAYDAWAELAKATPPGAPWIPMLRKNLTKLAAELDRPMPDLPEAQSQNGGQ